MDINLDNPDHRLAIEMVNVMFGREGNPRHAEKVEVNLVNAQGKKTQGFLKHDTTSALALAKMVGISKATMLHILAIRDPKRDGKFGKWHESLSPHDKLMVNEWLKKQRPRR